MAKLKAVGGGLVGACALTLIHETARRVMPEVAPRMDVLGMRAIKKAAGAADVELPPDDELHTITLVGDIVANTFYYSLVGIAGRENAVLAGTLLGAAAGVGAALLPEPLGLGAEPSARTPATQAMTVAWYTAGGLAAATAFLLFTSKSRRRA